MPIPDKRPPSRAVICDHGMPNPKSCVDCMAEGNLPTKPRPKAPTLEYWLTAQFDGICATCDLSITPGQRIARWSDGRYRHQGHTP